jgi:DNA-binding NarL/FixJ family response regulator
MIFGEAANCAEALAAAREQPEIILLDIDLHGESGLDMISQLLTIAKEARVIILTAMCNPEVQERAAFLGAMGVVSKDQSPEVLIKAIEKVHAGEVWLERSTMAKVLGTISHAGEAKDQSPEAAKIGSLTEREREIVNLVGAGLKSKEIANRLFICEGTVSHHLTSIFDKLEIHHRLELMVYAYRNGLAKLFL